MLLPGLLCIMVLAAKGQWTDGQYEEYRQYGPGEGGEEDWGGPRDQEYARSQEYDTGAHTWLTQEEGEGEEWNTEDGIEGGSPEKILRKNEKDFNEKETSGDDETIEEDNYCKESGDGGSGCKETPVNVNQTTKEEEMEASFEAELKELGEALLLSLNGSTGHIREITNKLWSSKDRIEGTYDKLEGLNKELRSVTTTEVT